MQTLRTRLLTLTPFPLLSIPKPKPPFSLSFFFPFPINPYINKTILLRSASNSALNETAKLLRTVLFVSPGIDPEQVTHDILLPGSNIVIGPFACDAKIKKVEFIKSSAKAKDCPSDGRPEFAILGRSNVGKSSMINAMCRKKEVALTSKKPGKTQLINHFLVNKSWYIGICMDMALLMPQNQLVETGRHSPKATFSTEKP